ncbi:hypothetical protein GIB67_023089 [Kingdonia uniflora]|uniref:Calcium uniporter protein n=1 Tax=Kingdonia uniflora TaxID=39325 RepID=A0A7J7M5T6_9MAGN|nr:hypothetical protein GIB67_023089 [Kingdonia uniflora]
MWRSMGMVLLKRGLSPLSTSTPSSSTMGLRWIRSTATSYCSVDASSKSDSDSEAISFAEVKKLMRLVNVESLKKKLGMEGEEVIGYSDLLKACETMGVARSAEEAAAFARVLDEAGVLLLFRDKVYLHPDKQSEVRVVSEFDIDIDIEVEIAVSE